MSEQVIKQWPRTQELSKSTYKPTTKRTQVQKVIRILQNCDSSQFARLFPPWRETFNSFSLDSIKLLYLDKRLVIPKNMRENLLTVIHFVHAIRDALLRSGRRLMVQNLPRDR